MSESVFVVQHVHAFEDGREDVKLVGVYSTRARADDAVRRARTRAGFRAAPDGFTVDEYMIDQDEWREGFVTAE